MSILTIGIIVGLIVIIALLMISIFNKFVKNRNLVQDAWSNIDVALKRRYDLIPNLSKPSKDMPPMKKTL